MRELRQARSNSAICCAGMRTLPAWRRWTAAAEPSNPCGARNWKSMLRKMRPVKSSSANGDRRRDFRLDTGCSILGTGCSILDTGCSIPDVRYWILDARCWLPEKKFIELIGLIELMVNRSVEFEPEGNVLSLSIRYPQSGIPNRKAGYWRDDNEV